MPTRSSRHEAPVLAARGEAHRLTWLCLVTIAACLVTLAIVLVATRDGPAIDPDSVTYFSVAENLAHHGGLETYWGASLTDFPPGYPALLSLGIDLGLNAAESSRWINAFCAAAIVALSSVLLRRFVRSPLLRGVGVAIVALSSAIVAVAASALSEPAFIVACLGFLCVLCAARTPTSTRRVLALAALATAAFMVRYLGWVLLALGALEVIRLRSSSFEMRVRRALLFVVTALAVPALWMAHNVSEGDGLLGPRPPTDATLPENVKFTARTATEWFLPDRLPLALRSLLAVLAILALVVVVVRRIRSPDVAEQLRAIEPLVAFVVLFLGVLIVSASITSVDPIDERLLAPIFAPLIITAMWGVERIRELHDGPLAASIVAVAIAVCLGVSAYASAELLAHDRLHGEWLDSGRRWRDSPLFDTIAALPAGSDIVSNDPARVFLRSGHLPVGESPNHGYRTATTSAVDLSRFADEVARGHPDWLVWFFHDTDQSGYISRARLAECVTLEEKQRAPDGVLYRLRLAVDDTSC